MGQSCKSALAIVGHTKDLQSTAMEFGEKASLAMRISEEIERPTDSKNLSSEERKKLPEILMHQCNSVLKFIDFLPHSNAKISLRNLVTALKVE